MLKTRLITAIIGIIVAVAVIQYGGYVFNTFVMILTLVGWHELVNMYFPQQKNAKGIQKYVGLPAIGYVFLLVMVGVCRPETYLPVVGIWALGTVIYGFLMKTGREVWRTSFLAIGGEFYLYAGFGALLLLRNDAVYQHTIHAVSVASPGLIIIWLAFLGTWASDTFAYFAGRAWGKHRIVPNISPNKTLEGFIGGFIGTIVVGVVYSHFTGLDMGLGAVLSVLIGIAAPLGDLFESKLKRISGVKDSGNILPGHGGVLDRFDSILFVAPVVFFFLLLV